MNPRKENIRHLSNKKRTGAEKLPALFLHCIHQFLALSLLTVPEVLAKVSLA